MTGIKKYGSATGMRMALEERLKKISKDEAIDIIKLRRHVSFDRLLARIFFSAPDDIIVKGGYAIELRLDYARTTKDVDISFKGTPNGFWVNDKEKLQEYLQQCASVDLDDFFDFVIGSASLDLENAPYGGYRFPVETRMAGRLFSRFSIDMATGDAWIEPHEVVYPHEWLGFAGIESPKIPLISMEQQFAEKLHAYTLPRERPNSRVKDIVDILALIQTGQLDTEKLKMALKATFKRRKTHDFPPILPDVPVNWTSPFKKMANECNIGIEIERAIEDIKTFCNQHGLMK